MLVTTLISIISDFPMSPCTSLPPELVNEVIDDISDNALLKPFSLMSRSWSYPARSRLFHHVRVRPEEVEDWLSRPPESVQRMAPHIAKFELQGRRGGPLVEPSFRWDDSEGILTRVIKPICHSLRSLELQNLVTCADAVRYFISLFPDLDDLYIDDVFPASIRSAQE